MARDAFSPPMPLAQYSKPLTNNGQLRKIMRNKKKKKKPTLLSLKRKQQLVLATVDLIFLAPTPADVISSDVLKTEIECIKKRN